MSFMWHRGGVTGDTETISQRAVSRWLTVTAIGLPPGYVPTRGIAKTNPCTSTNLARLLSPVVWLAATLALLSSCATEDGNVSSVEGIGGESDMVAALQKHEELISVCMRREGFAYIAHVPAYAIIEQALSDAHGSVLTDEQIIDGLELPPDPNAELVKEMSDDERSQYSEARRTCFDTTQPEADGFTPPELLVPGEELEALAERLENDRSQ